MPEPVYLFMTRMVNNWDRMDVPLDGKPVPWRHLNDKEKAKFIVKQLISRYLKEEEEWLKKVLLSESSEDQAR